MTPAFTFRFCKNIFSSLALLSLCAVGLQSQASVSVKNGMVTIDVSGADAANWGDDGDSAGKVNLTLAYSDATKTQVSITGTTEQYGKTATIAEIVALKDLKQITIYADGGNGANGYDGADGSQGSSGDDGSSGMSGCPASSGGSGGNGGNGGDGSNAGDGGNGGRGGSVTINTPADQTELYEFVRIGVYGGNGGDGGTGGSGGAGGPGGAGGQGGMDTCDTSNGGPDYGSGANGSPGASGNSGAGGYDGAGGYAGANGARTINVVNSPTSTVSYPSMFALKIAATVIDDNQDGILEPGENLNVMQIVVSNSGPMPTPLGQVIQLSLPDNSTLKFSKASALTINQPIAGNSSATLNFKKGDVVLQVPDNKALIGKKVMLGMHAEINTIAVADQSLDTGIAVHWPVSLSTAASKVTLDYEIAKPLAFSLKNVGSQMLGPKGDQPIELDLTWVSKTIPGTDVSVTLPDGRAFVLGQTAVITDLSVPANNTQVLPLTLMIRDSKVVQSGAGVLNVSLKLNDPATSAPEALQTTTVNVTSVLNVPALVYNDTFDLSALKLTCTFKNQTPQSMPITSIQVSKVKASNVMEVQLSAQAASAVIQSPVLKLNASTFMTYLENFESTDVAKTTLTLLNKLIVPATPKGTNAWTITSCVQGN